MISIEDYNVYKLLPESYIPKMFQAEQCLLVASSCNVREYISADPDRMRKGSAMRLQRHLPAALSHMP